MLRMSNSSILSTILLVLICCYFTIILVVTAAYAEQQEDYNKDGIYQYKNWDGRILNEKQHQLRVQECIDMWLNADIIDPNTPCNEWVLTQKGESMVEDYMATKYYNMN